jgi:alkylation response protein AidB-like acyl-CoA dehydrogenase
MAASNGLDLNELRSEVRKVLTSQFDGEQLRRFVSGPEIWDQSLWSTVGELGWLSLGVPEDGGGLGMGVREQGVIHAEIGRAAAPLPFLATTLVIDALVNAGTPAQREAWLPRLLSGKSPASVALPEPGGGPGSASLDGANFILSGVASELLDGAVADLLLIEATDEHGIGRYVLVDPNAEGVEVTREELTDRTRHIAMARFTHHRIDADRVLPGDAAALRLLLLDRAALALAHEAVGTAEALLEMTVAYLKVREQFGRPIGSFQALKHRCATMKVDLEASRAAVEEASDAVADGRSDASLAASLAKAYACRVAAEVAEQAVQLHGGIGFTWEHPCHVFLKRAKLGEALGGTERAHADRAASLLLATGQEAQSEPAEAQAAASRTDAVQADFAALTDLAEFRAQVRGWLKANVPAGWRASLDHADEAAVVEFNRSWYLRVQSVGLAAPHWPRAWGGAEMSVDQQVVVYEELARIDAPDLGVYHISLYHLPATMFSHGTAVQRERYITGVKERGEIWCQGFSEPGAGSDLASLQTRAERRGDKYAINGQKIWSSYAAYSDFCLLLARTDPTAPKKHQGISYFILDMRAPGVTVRPIRQATGEAEFCEIFLDEVEIPVENLIGVENTGWTIAQSTLSSERSLLLFDATERLKRQIDADLASADRSAGWFSDDELRRTHVRHQASLLGLRRMIQGLLHSIKVNPEINDSILPPLIKIQFSELVQRYTEFRVRADGLSAQRAAPGTAAHLAHSSRMYRYLQSFGATIAGGANEIIRNVIAERQLGLPR